MTSRLVELAERVEKLTGPCRDTDGEIAAALALHPQGWRRGVPEACATAVWFNDKTGQSWSAPALTGSFDAAMTLVPEGYCPCIDFRQPQTTIFNARGKKAVEAAYGMTAVCSLVSAALRARAASEPSHGG